MRARSEPTSRRRLAPVLLALAGLALAGGCSTLQQGLDKLTPSQRDLRSRGWTEAREVDTEPSVFCYITRAQPDCYREQQVGERDRLIDKDAPQPEPGRRIVTGQRSPERQMRRLPPKQEPTKPAQPGKVDSAPLPAPASAQGGSASQPVPEPIAVTPAPKPQAQARRRPGQEQMSAVAAALDGLGDYRLTEEGTLVLPTAGVFPSGRAQLTGQARARLQELARRLAEVTAELPDDSNWRLRVTGHADRRPIQTDRYPSNWVLSSARAASVAELFAQAGIPRDRIVPAGYGAARPRTPGETPAQRAANRRIEMSLVAPQALAEAAPES